MKKTVFTHCGLLITLLLLTSCALIPVHKPDLEQGNIITTDMASQLKTGMSTRQVLNILGTPVLENAFTDATRWYYIYTFENGKTGNTQHKYLIISFRNHIVTDIVNAYPTTPFS